MTKDDKEFNALLRDFRNLSQDQRNLLIRKVVGRARAYRAQAIRELFDRVIAWFRRRAAILQLQALDDRMLKDIGINRGDIENVVAEPPIRLDAARSRRPQVPAPLPRDIGRAA